MDNFEIYQDIRNRTDGDIYIGVVGPVRTGKSTFIKKFMELLVLPNIEDEDLKKRDNNGRRIYLTSEFNQLGRLKECQSTNVINADKIKRYIEKEKEKIIDHDVFDINGNSVALSKDEYATNILNGLPPFDTVNFTGFTALFERLESIIKDID